jgi:hypothetical protein
LDDLALGEVHPPGGLLEILLYEVLLELREEDGAAGLASQNLGKLVASRFDDACGF